MQHSFIDKYHYLDSPLHRLDPRVRVCLFLLLILAAVTTPAVSMFKLVATALFLALLAAVSRIPPLFVLKRVLAVLPFLVMALLMAPFLEVSRPTVVLDMRLAKIAVDSRLVIVVAAFMKALISVVSVIVLLNSGRFSDFLKALQTLKVPAVLTSLLMFIYRYIFIIIDQFQRMFIARRSRTFSNRRTWCGLPGLIGVGFIRASERGERVYASMLSRGFNGTIRTTDQFKIGTSDLIFALLFLTILTLIRFG
jgi:cobalt/nickel transport system permease protein